MKIEQAFILSAIDAWFKDTFHSIDENQHRWLKNTVDDLKNRFVVSVDFPISVPTPPPAPNEDLDNANSSNQ